MKIIDAFGVRAGDKNQADDTNIEWTHNLDPNGYQIELIQEN